MPLRLERTDWMLSPPLAPDDGPIDAAHLARMTLGDSGLTREVLTMFASQATRVMAALAGPGADRVALAHTLKGSAGAIGAFAVAEAAEALASAAAGSEGAATAALDRALAEALAAIDAMLGRS